MIINVSSIVSRYIKHHPTSFIIKSIKNVLKSDEFIILLNEEMLVMSDETDHEGMKKNHKRGK